MEKYYIKEVCGCGDIGFSDLCAEDRRQIRHRGGYRFFEKGQGDGKNDEF